MSWWITGLIVATLALAITAVHRRYLDSLAVFPGPFWASVSGVYDAYWQYRGDGHLQQRRLHEKYGPVVRWGPKHLIVADARLLPTIYHMKADKTSFYQSHLNESSATVFSERESHEHIRRRRALAHAYSQSNVRQMEGTVRDLVATWVQRLGAEVAETTTTTAALWERVLWLSYDGLGLFAFGQPFGFVQGWRDLDDVIARASASSTSARVLDVLCYNPLLSWLARNTRLGSRWMLPWSTDEQGVGVLKALRDAAMRRAEGGGGDAGEKHIGIGIGIGTGTGINGPPPPPDSKFRTNPEFRSLLHTMRHDHDHDATETATAARAGIRAELLIAILAGTSTTATVIHALFVQVGSIPAVAARLRQELDQEHAAACSSSCSSSSPPDSTSLARLPYLTACIHEAFRLSAMPTQFPRRVGAARSVVIDGHVLPPDTVLSSSSYILSRDQQLFGDAVDEFHPERWLDVDPVTAARRARYDFRFGYGARTCLGKHLVMLELYHAADAFFRVLDVRVDEGKKVLLRLRNNDVVEGGK